MPVPFRLSTLGKLLAGLLSGVVLLPCARAAKPPVPALNLPLEALGYQPVPNRYFLLGDSVLSLHFVDDMHLLVTFTSRGLLTRLPDARETDEDQNVAAVLLELPTGKVLARTVWRERDRGQYLWSIGHGRFILRIRSKLTLLDPLANLAAGKPFEEEPFVELNRRVGYIAISPSADLLSIETVPAPKPNPAATPSAAAGPAPIAQAQLQLKQRPPQDLAEIPDVQINFFRLAYAKPVDKPEHLTIQSAGVVRARNLIDIPATADGYLDVSQESPGVYLFDFQAHGGKRRELSPFDTSCAPMPHFVSASEFIAFGCRGNEDKQQMAGFNLHGEEAWINAFPNRHYFPAVVDAPSAGRFALSRTILTGTYIDLDNLTAEQISGQEVTVMQTWDGRVLFKLNATPFQRAGQNFDLSPNGLNFAILHDGKVQVYPLPPLTRKDTEAVRLASSYAPEHTEARISLGGKPNHKSGVPEEKAAKQSVGAPPTAATDAVASQTNPETQAQAAVSPAQSQAASASQSREANQLQNGDPDPSQHRSPPTLYDKEHPRQKGDPKPSVDNDPR